MDERGRGRRTFEGKKYSKVSYRFSARRGPDLLLLQFLAWFYVHKWFCCLQIFYFGPAEKKYVSIILSF